MIHLVVHCTKQYLIFRLLFYYIDMFTMSENDGLWSGSTCHVFFNISYLCVKYASLHVIIANYMCRKTLMLTYISKFNILSVFFYVSNRWGKKWIDKSSASLVKHCGKYNFE